MILPLKIMILPLKIMMFVAAGDEQCLLLDKARCGMPSLTDSTCHHWLDLTWNAIIDWPQTPASRQTQNCAVLWTSWSTRSSSWCTTCLSLKVASSGSCSQRITQFTQPHRRSSLITWRRFCSAPAGGQHSVPSSLCPGRPLSLHARARPLTPSPHLAVSWLLTQRYRNQRRIRRLARQAVSLSHSYIVYTCRRLIDLSFLDRVIHAGDWQIERLLQVSSSSRMILSRWSAWCVAWCCWYSSS